MPPIRQPSFAAGELGPDYRAASDLEAYGRGARRLRNFFVSKGGRAVSRPGLKHIASGKTPANKVRLVPFTYSADTGYALEFGDQYIRFLYQGAQLESSPGVPLEVPTPYVTADLFKLKFDQSGDVLTITHRSYTPRTLSRTAHLAWTLATMDFSVPAWFGSANYRALTPLPVADTAHPATDWAYRVTAVGRTLSGMLVESLPVDVTLDSGGAALAASLAIYQDKPLTIALSGGAGTLPAHVQSFVGYRIYRGRSGTYGFVGEKLGPQVTTWIDYGQDPDFSTVPPKGRNPFQVLAADGSTVTRTEEPGACCYYDDRHVFAGTDERPTQTFMSAVGSYLNFDERRPSTADEAIELQLASRIREETRSLLPRRQLLEFTDASVWALAGEEGPIKPTALIDGKVVSEIGASWLQPLLAGSRVLYERAMGGAVLDLQPSEGGYTAVEISALAEHLLDGYTIADWCYAKNPWGVIWAVRSDGQLLSLTLSGDRAGWGWHDTGAGVTQEHDYSPLYNAFESICAVPEGTETAVYVSVRRVSTAGTYRSLERMTSRNFKTSSTLADVVCLDAAYTYSGAPTLTVTGLTWLAGQIVDVVTSEAFGAIHVRAGLAVDGAGTLTLPALASKAQIGLRYYPEMETLDHPEARAHKKVVRKVLFDCVASLGVSVGQDFSHLHDWRDGNPAAPTVLLDGLAEVAVSHAWSKDGGRAVLRQTKPFPVTVAGLIREMEVGGGA